MSGADPSRPTVVLISDDPGGRGGIATVARQIAASLSPDPVVVRPSYRRDAGPVTQLRLVAASAAYLVGHVRRRAGLLVHVHLSQRGSFVREGLLIALAKRLGYRVVVTLHGSESLEFIAARPRPTRRVLGWADQLYCLGPGRAAAVTSLTGVPAGVLCNYVDVPTAAPLPTGRQALFVGALSIRKGVDVLAQAWPRVLERVPDAELLVVGTDLGAGVRLTGLPHCTTTGELPAARVQELMAASTVVVLPSRAEGQPMVLLEAMALGTPVVATDVGEVRWSVGDGGIVVAADDAGALADALVAVLGDADRRASLSQQARAVVTERFSTAVGRLRYADVYRLPR